MPCYTVQTTDVKFKVEHMDLLEQALKALNWTFAKDLSYDRSTVKAYLLGNGIRIDLTTGLARVTESQQDKLNELKRAYSKEALKKFAKLNQWSIPATGKVNKGTLIKTYV